MNLQFSPDLKPRYGYGQPPHPKLYELFSQGRPRYGALLRKFLAFEKNFAAIKLNQESNPEIGADSSPIWINGWFPGLDAIAAYGFLSVLNPQRFVEIGSGHSTRFVRQAIIDHKLSTRIISVDPEPRADIDKICDEVHRIKIEDFSSNLFESLNAGDILFIDSSHLVLMNSDVTVLFLEIIPLLKKGVIIHFHDIHLPNDYPPDWIPRYYSEQYILGALLLSAADRFQVLLPNAFLFHYDQESLSILDPLRKNPALKDLEWYGGSLWLRVMN